MKVTKGQVKAYSRKVIAFYVSGELVFRDKYSNKNFVLSNNTVYTGSFEFEEYLKISSDAQDLITFYEGDTIVIEL